MSGPFREDMVRISTFKIPTALVLLILSGCATTQTVQTPSGRPEVAIHSPKKTVIDWIANAYSRAGYQIKTVNDFSLVAEKPIESAAMALAFGTSFARHPDTRVTLSFADSPAGTVVQARLEIVTNPGSGYENVSDVSRDAANLQADLVTFKSQLENTTATAK